MYPPTLAATICLTFTFVPMLQADEYMNVEISGKIRTGLFAVGGETTGSDITANGWRFELEYPKQELAELADKLSESGKSAHVLGEFRLQPGVELADRWVLTVKKVRPTPHKVKPFIKIALIGDFEKIGDMIATRKIKWKVDLSQSHLPAKTKARLVGQMAAEGHVHLGGKLKEKSGDNPPEFVVDFIYDGKKSKLTDFSELK